MIPHNSPGPKGRRPPSVCWGLLVLLSVWVTGWTGAQAQPAPVALTPGKPIEQPLTSGESHSYQLTLAADQFCLLTAEQRGIDLEIWIYGPDGKKLFEMDTLNSTQGPEIAGLLASHPGTYRIEIVSTTRNVPAGRYRLEAQAPRAATSADRTWLTAQQAFLEGGALAARPTEEEKTRAIARFETASRQWREIGDARMAVHALYGISSCYQNLSRRAQALAVTRQALDLLRGLGSQREEAPTLISIGNIEYELGDPKAALQALTEALEKWRAFDDPYGEGRTRNSLGAVYNSLGDTGMALTQYAAARAIWQRYENRARLAEAVAGIGRAHEIRGEWQKALEFYEQGLALHRSASNSGGEASMLNNLGVLHGRLNEPREELEYYRRAIELWRKIRNRHEEAVTLANMGTAEQSLNDPNAAMEHYQQALRLMREEGNRLGEASVLQYLGAFHAVAEPDKALAEYRQALQLLQAAGAIWREAYLLCQLGRLQLDLGKPEQAAADSARALAIFQSVGDSHGQAQALYASARGLRGLGRLEDALRSIESAISHEEAVRADVVSRQLRTSFLASVQDYYAFEIDLLMRLDRDRPGAGFAARALQVSERARARGLLESLAEAGANIREGADAALLDQERDLSLRLNSKALALLQLGGGQSELADSLKREIGQLESEYEKTQAALRRASPHYASITQPQALSLAELRAQLDPDTMLLEYSLGEERSYLWAVTGDSIESFALPKQDEINRAARRVYDLLTARSQRKRNETPAQQRERIAQADAGLPEAAEVLSRMVLHPVASRLGQRKLILVTDGALQYIPFGMLPLPDASEGDARARARRALLLQNEVVSLPSASTLAVQRRELAGRAPASRDIAIIADPVFSRQDDRTRRGRVPLRTGSRSVEHEDEATVTIGRFSIPRLPFTRQEADRILALSPAGDNLKLLDFKATRAALLQPSLGKYRYLHFATHGLMDSERPGLSALVLSLVDENGKPQDGFLRAHEIYNMHLPADLVVLSACQTGLGKEIRGEGLVGLTRGFMYAGAARIVVSLWNVNDRATAELMVRFYRKMLREGLRPASALRAAQLELLRVPQWQAPYYWAAFALQGEWR